MPGDKIHNDIHTIRHVNASKNEKKYTKIADLCQVQFPII